MAEAAATPTFADEDTGRRSRDVQLVAGPGAPYWPREDGDLLPMGARPMGADHGKQEFLVIEPASGSGRERARAEDSFSSDASPDTFAPSAMTVRRAKYRASVVVQTESEELLQVRGIQGPG